MSDKDEEDGGVRTMLDVIKDDVRQEGLPPDTPEFARRMRQMQVIRCREMRGHAVCTDCPVYDFCELVKRVMRENQGISE